MVEELTGKRQRRLASFIKPFRVTPGRTVDLARDFDPAFKGGISKKREGVALLEEGVQLLSEYQARLAAQNTWGSSSSCRRSTRPGRMGRSGT